MKLMRPTLITHWYHKLSIWGTLIACSANLSSRSTVGLDFGFLIRHHRIDNFNAGGTWLLSLGYLILKLGSAIAWNFPKVLVMCENGVQPNKRLYKMQPSDQTSDL